MKTITLSAADRQLIQRLIARPSGKADIATAKHIREIRRRLDLRKFSKQNDKLTEGLQELNLSISWDDMIDSKEFLASLDELLCEEKVEKEKEKLEKLKAKVAEFLTPAGYTIDDSHLRWVRKGLQEQEWDKVQVIVGSDVKDVTLNVHPSQYEAIADLDDKLADSALE